MGLEKSGIDQNSKCHIKFDNLNKLMVLDDMLSVLVNNSLLRVDLQ